ncbi:MAG: 4Fe-4S dicluster domain-containing protein [Candidatus Bathyarchaeota archaeon]|nr:MAG: 4Fe-4S dicluster domain-containing protein [Candidatus Bathyarchaeota archaeon]
MKRISSNINRCSGCRLCELHCSCKKEGVSEPATSRVYVKKDDQLGIDFPLLCWHCDPCNAIQNCEQNALQKNEDGLIYLDEARCIGCGSCIDACIIEAIRLHPVQNIPMICDQCGGVPVCVQKCPTQALSFKETKEKTPRLLGQVVKDALKSWGVSA